MAKEHLYRKLATLLRSGVVFPLRSFYAFAARQLKQCATSYLCADRSALGGLVLSKSRVESLSNDG